MSIVDWDGGSDAADGFRQGEGRLSRRLRVYEGRAAQRVVRLKGGQRPNVLHLLSQQPGKTGSGVYLEAMLRHGTEIGIEQRVVVGMPAGEKLPRIEPVSEADVIAVRFDTPDLPYPVAGMSDVMPYESTCFSSFTPAMLEGYLLAFRDALTRATEGFEPNLIHSHHLWLATALARMVFPHLPLVTTCHGTELRQLDLASGLRPYVLPACADVDRVLALHFDHMERIAALYGMSRERIVQVGAGYRKDIFHCSEEQNDRERGKHLTVVYAGKLSRAKGLPWLIEAFQGMEAPCGREVRLLIAGAASASEADAIRESAAGDDRIGFLGALSQDELARVFREADVFVLPSFYEGLPLVVLEAAACGCRVVVTDLPGMEGWLPEELKLTGTVERVPLPRLHGPDEPYPADLPRFTTLLKEAIGRQLERCVLAGCDERPEAIANGLSRMTWEEVSQRIKAVYDDLLWSDAPR